MSINEIVSLFGGTVNLSKKLNVTPSSITHWTTRKKIPSNKKIKLLDLSKKHNLNLTLTDFD